MAADRVPDGHLFDLYRTYIGEPDSETDVYVGFSFFLGGVIVAALALGLFLFSATLEPRTEEYFAWVEPAYALGMVALPATMLGIVVLLPADRKVLFASVGGVLVTLVAIGGFLALYPSNWNFYETSDAAFSTVHVVAVYAVGLASLSAATGGALIGHYLEVARTSDAVDTDENDDDGVHYTDDDIERDIDEAMEDVELSWGGVAKTENTRLEFSDHGFEETSFDAGVGVKTTRASGTNVDDAVAGLKGLKGGEATTETSSSTVDEQTQKLKELREQQRAEELATADVGALESLKQTLLGLLGRGR